MRSAFVTCRNMLNRLPTTLLGMLIMIASTILFAVMHGGVRYVSSDLHPFEIAFFRNLFGFFVLLPWFVRQGLRPLHTRHFILHTWRASVNLVAMLMFFTALSMTPLAQVQALGFTAPLFATLLAILILREKVRLRRYSALIVGFIGAMIVIRPGFQAVDLGSLLVLGSAAIWALALIMIKVLSRTDSSVTITAYMVVLMTPLSLVPALLYWQWPTTSQLLWLVFIGVTGTLGQLALAEAFRVTEATIVLPLDFMKLVWGAMIGYIAFNEAPGIWTWLGGTIIFAGATYIAYRESQLKSHARAQTPQTAVHESRAQGLDVTRAEHISDKGL